MDVFIRSGFCCHFRQLVCKIEKKVVQLCLLLFSFISLYGISFLPSVVSYGGTIHHTILLYYQHIESNHSLYIQECVVQCIQNNKIKFIFDFCVSLSLTMFSTYDKFITWFFPKNNFEFICAIREHRSSYTDLVEKKLCELFFFFFCSLLVLLSIFVHQNIKKITHTKK